MSFAFDGLSSVSDQGIPASNIDVYLISPFLLRAMRKVKLLPMQLQSLAAQEMARARTSSSSSSNSNNNNSSSSSSSSSSAAAVAAEIDQQQQQQHKEPQVLLRNAEQHVKLPNPLSLRMKGAAAAQPPLPPLAAAAGPAATAAGGAAAGRGSSLLSSSSSAATAATTRGGEGREGASGGLIDVFLCCGGKDMLALDWLPFVSRFLHFCLSSKVKRQQLQALKNGRLTFGEDAVLKAALSSLRRSPSTDSSQRHPAASRIAEILANAAQQQVTTNSKNNNTTTHTTTTHTTTTHTTTTHTSSNRETQRRDQGAADGRDNRTIEDAMEFEVRLTERQMTERETEREETPAHITHLPPPHPSLAVVVVAAAAAAAAITGAAIAAAASSSSSSSGIRIERLRRGTNVCGGFSCG